MEVRDSANEMLGRLMSVISDGLTIENTIHKDLYTQITDQFSGILKV